MIQLDGQDGDKSAKPANALVMNLWGTDKDDGTANGDGRQNSNLKNYLASKQISQLVQVIDTMAL